MAWTKIPKEHHPIFLAALPDDERIVPKVMFGSIAAMVNGNMMGSLWAHSFAVRVGEADYREALALGGQPFDPMGRGNAMHAMVELPESVFRQPAQLRKWLAKALTFTAAMPPKVKKKTKARG